MSAFVEQDKVVTELIGLPLFVKLPSSREEYQKVIATAYNKGQCMCDEELISPLSEHEYAALFEPRNKMRESANRHFLYLFNMGLPFSLFSYQRRVAMAFKEGWIMGAVDKAESRYDMSRIGVKV